MVKEYEIAAFINDEKDLKFLGAYAFEGKHGILLFEKNGHILLCDKETTEQLVQKKIPDRLLHILIQRHFVETQQWNVRFRDGKMPIEPEFFMVDLTDNCCMSCTYCLRNIKNEEQGKRQISNRVLHDICEYITAYCDEVRPPHITIQPWGGEPMLAYDAITEMKRLIAPRFTKVHYSMETNGILLSKERIGELHKERISLSISLDGTRETHDMQRIFPNGQGTFDNVYNSIKRTEKKYGKQFGNITTITRNLYDRVEEIMDYYAKELGLLHIKFNYVHQSDFSAYENMCLSEEEIAVTQIRILNKLVSLHEEGYLVTEENIMTKLRNILFDHSADICLSRGCNGGRKMIVFDREGRIYPCELTDYPQESMGNIYEQVPLKQLIEQAVRERTFFREKKQEMCKECLWWHYCQGGCTMHCMSSGRKQSLVDTIECSVNRVLYPALIRLILEKSEMINHFLGYRAVEW